MHVRDHGAKYWSIQTTIKAAYGRGRRIEMGIGRYPHITLEKARKAAIRCGLCQGPLSGHTRLSLRLRQWLLKA